MTVLFALIAALCNALNVVTQHIASTTPRTERGMRFVLRLFRSPMWLFGWVALAGAFASQAIALHFGRLSVVQPLLITELVFVLVLRRLWIRQSIRGITWSAAALSTAGLAIFLVAAEPQGGDTVVKASAWISATAVFLGSVGLLALLARSGSPARRAAVFGTATAITWALVAVFMKETTDVVANSGVGALFETWPVYALASVGLLAEVLNQVTLHVGPLSVSQPFLVIVDPIVSIVLSVWIFNETFTASPAAMTVGVISFVGMCAGVVLLIRTSPDTITRPRS